MWKVNPMDGSGSSSRSMLGQSVSNSIVILGDSCNVIGSSIKRREGSAAIDRVVNRAINRAGVEQSAVTIK